MFVALTVMKLYTCVRPFLLYDTRKNRRKTPRNNNEKMNEKNKRRRRRSKLLNDGMKQRERYELKMKSKHNNAKDQ